jgi:hypothetical protein
LVCDQNDDPTDPTFHSSPAATAYLDSAYISLTDSLTKLKDPAYQEAYRTCFRVRVYSWVIHDLPDHSDITPDDVMIWLGVRVQKTFKNMIARFNGAKLSVDWMREKRDSLNQRDTFNFQVLSKLVEGALTLLPTHSMGLEPIIEDMDTNVADAAVGMSASSLDRLIRDIKLRKRMEER